MVASHLGIFRSFTVRIVYTEQAIIVAGIRRSALVSVSRNFELLQTERKSRDAGDGRERETLKVGPTRVTRERTLISRSANDEFNRVLRKKSAAASAPKRLRCPDAVTGAARSRRNH